MPARKRTAEVARADRTARRAGLPGSVPALSPGQRRRVEEAAAWRDHEQGDVCWRNCQ